LERDADRGAGEGGIRPRRWMALALAAGVFMSGCASSDTRMVGQYPGATALQDWRTIANTNLPGRGEILKVVDLGRSDALSNHLAIVQSRELPHRHNRHDSTVTLLRGHGTMSVGRETRHVREGAVIFIPRGVVHHFSNESDPPTVAIVVYAPPFDGRDREIVTATGTEVSPEESSSGGESAEPAADVAPDPASSGAPAEQVPLQESEPSQESVAPADGAGAGEPGTPATSDAQPEPPPRDPVLGGTEPAPGGSDLPESSPGAVIEGVPGAPPPPAP